MTKMIENKTFDEIAIGDSASMVRMLHAGDAETWAAVTGNVNLIDLDPGPADTSMFAHGGGQVMWAATLFSTLAGTELPGLGSVTTGANVRFHKPVAVDVPVKVSITVTEKKPGEGSVILACLATDTAGETLISGMIEVLAARTKQRFPLRDLPKVQLRREERYLQLIQMCEGLPTLPTAVVHPCSDDSLIGAVEAAELNLIDPILVGPAAKLRSAAAAAGIDISPYRLIDSQHSHHSAELAVALVREGEASALMKGSLHTDELLEAVMSRDSGLRTERRISHCFLLAVPTYARPIIVTDAAININPTLADKAHICQNAIDLARCLGISEPKVAILSAVETVTPKIPSTLDAAALCKMADRGQITGGLLDGPLAFDNAIDIEAAKTKGIHSPVAGVADVLIVPNLEAGNMLAKQLTFMADAEAAGIVIGARAPIVLTSRADSARTRLASCAVAVLLAEAQRKGEAMLKAAAE